MEEDIKQKGDEILEILEKDLIRHTQALLKVSAGVDISVKDAEVIVAKVGKRLLIKIAKDPSN